MNIEDCFENAQKKAVAALFALDFVKGTPTKMRGLDGWVFEQVVRNGLEQEMRKKKVKSEIAEQVSIGGRAKVDLVIGCVAIETKLSGYYDDVEERYKGYRKRIEKMGLTYFYVTLYEKYLPNLKAAHRVYGKDRVFVLSESGAWGRFAFAFIKQLRKKPSLTSESGG